MTECGGETANNLGSVEINIIAARQLLLQSTWYYIVYSHSMYSVQFHHFMAWPANDTQIVLSSDAHAAVCRDCQYELKIE